MSTFIDGIAQCEVIDKSGEILDLKGHDISSLAKTGTFNWEHQSNTPATLVGKILKAKKIFSKDDCGTDRELYFWNKCKKPYLYIMGELLDDYTQSARECAGQMRYSKDNPDKAPLLGFSIEGSELPGTRKGPMITRSIARKCTLTVSPCNSMCVAEIYEFPEQKSQIKDDFEELFKTEANAITLFKSGEGEKLYETYLVKKESESTTENKYCAKHNNLNKSQGANWSTGKSNNGDAIHFAHPEHNIVSIHKQPSGEFHVKHNGRIAGVGGKRGVFDNAKEAGEHAQKFMTGLSNGTIAASPMQNHPSPNIIGTSIKKAITADSYNSAPSTLVNGSAYQTENLAKEQNSSEEHNFKGSKKKDWNLRAKQDYKNWPHREKFEKFMKSKMPHLSKGEIEAFGRIIALKKNIEFEGSLSGLVGFNKTEESTLEKSINMPKSKSSGMINGWRGSIKNHPKVGTMATFEHPNHDPVTVHKDPDSKMYHVKQGGAMAGLKGIAGKFGTAKEAMGHAKNYIQALNSGTVAGKRAINGPSDPNAQKPSAHKSEEPKK